MKSAELVKVISEKVRISQTVVAEVLKSLAVVVEDTLKEGGKLTLPGIAILSTAEVAARAGINPQTWEPLQINAYTKVKFRPVKSLKDSIK